MHTVTESNAKSRQVGESALSILWGQKTLLPQYKSQTLTGESISNPIAFKSGLRPETDGATPDAKDGVTQANGIRKWDGETFNVRLALQRLGKSVAEKRADRDTRALGMERELTIEASSAAALALGQFIARAERLGILTARETLGFLPSRGRFPRSVYAAAHRAADRALRKSSATRLVETAFFNTFALETSAKKLRNPWQASEHASESDAYPWQEERNADLPSDLQKALILTRCNKVRDCIREAIDGTKSNRKLGAARRHLATVQRCEDAALASLSGNVFAFEDAHKFAADIIGHETEKLTIRNKGRIVAHDGKGSATGSRKVIARGGVSEANSLSYERMRQLAEFIGIPFSAKSNGFALLF